ncbi:MAG TPA: alpha/beta hydrolase [Terriglobia bacterium]
MPGSNPCERSKKSWLRRTLFAILLLVLVSGLAVYLRPLWVWQHATRAWLRLEGARSEYVRLGPYRIHYLVAGEGKPLVLVHGLGGRAENWALLIPPLANSGHRVYAIDLLGYGRSDRPNVDYSIALQAQILDQFLGSQHIERSDLGGWSMGGWIALKFTIDHPERVRRVFVTDSAGMNFRLSWDPALFNPKTPQQVDQFIAILTPHPRHIPHFVARDLIREFREQDWVIGRSMTSMRAGADLLDGKLTRISLPVLIVWGKQDATTPLACGEEMHREMPQSILAVFDGCGHLAPVLCRSAVLPEIIRFLAADLPLAGGAQEFSR